LLSFSLFQRIEERKRRDCLRKGENTKRRTERLEKLLSSLMASAMRESLELKNNEIIPDGTLIFRSQQLFLRESQAKSFDFQFVIDVEWHIPAESSYRDNTQSISTFKFSEPLELA
jgi:hypothetical protein